MWTLFFLLVCLFGQGWFVRKQILDSEKHINMPAIIYTSWFGADGLNLGLLICNTRRERSIGFLGGLSESRSCMEWIKAQFFLLDFMLLYTSWQAVTVNSQLLFFKFSTADRNVRAPRSFFFFLKELVHTNHIPNQGCTNEREPYPSALHAAWIQSHKSLFTEEGSQSYSLWGIRRTGEECVGRTLWKEIVLETLCGCHRQRSS